MPRMPPHWKLRTSIMNDLEYPDVWADNDLLAAYTRLGILAIERYADRTDDTFVIHERELPAIMGKGRSDSALRAFQKLLTSCELVAHYCPTSDQLVGNYQGGSWSVHWPKHTKRQGFKPRNGSETEPPTTTTTTTTNSHLKNGAKPRRTKPPPPEWSLWVAGLLAEHFRAARPGGRVPKDLATWARPIAEIEAPPGQIADVVRWLYSPANEGQYRIEVQCGKALRDKYGNALAAIERKRVRSTSGSIDAAQQALNGFIEEDSHGVQQPARTGLESRGGGGALRALPRS